MDPISAEQEKIDALNRKAWKMRIIDARRCSYLCEEAIELAKSIHYKKGIAESLRTNAFTMIGYHRYEQAAELLDEARSIFIELGDESGQSDIHEVYGIINRLTGDYTSSLEHFYSAYRLRKHHDYAEGKNMALFQLGYTYRQLGNQEKALEFLLNSLEPLQQYSNPITEAHSLEAIGNIYLELQESRESLKYLQLALDKIAKQGNKTDLARILDQIGQCHFLLKDSDNANNYFLKSIETSSSAGDKDGEANTLLHLARLELTQSNEDLAYEYASRCLSLRNAIGDKRGQAEVLLFLIRLSADKEAVPLMKKALDLAMASEAPELVMRLQYLYYEYYKNCRQYDKALEFLEQFEKKQKEFQLKTATQKIDNVKLANLVEQHQYQLEIDRLQSNHTRLQFENEAMKKELAHVNEELNAIRQEAISREIASPATNLVTVIANELQHPVSILSNFPVTSMGVIETLQSDMRKGNTAEVTKISGEFKSELKKILVHGQQAEALLTLMVRHVQPATGKKQITDLNQLVDEYLRLAYHGMRSRDKIFSADLDLQFEKKGAMMNVIPELIGRAIFIILESVLYDINEKRKILGESFEPTVFITTRWDVIKNSTRTFQIIIKDNGNGNPPASSRYLSQSSPSGEPGGHITDGQLSLIHEIVNAHHGQLKINKVQGEFTQYIICLPEAQPDPSI